MTYCEVDTDHKPLVTLLSGYRKTVALCYNSIFIELAVVGGLVV